MIGKPDAIIRWLTEQDRETEFEIKKYHKKRSLNANNYAWALITQIADRLSNDKLTLTKEEVYLRMLQDYGQSEMITLVKGINIDGYIKYYKKAGESVINGTEAVHYLVYKGSSEMDSKEMAILIDGIVQEAKNLGIQTLEDAEIERLKKGWNNYDN